MPTLLAIDTALEACAVSVSTGGQMHTIYEPMKRGQTERLLPMIMEACEVIDVSLKDMNGVCVTRGPGSFTGVRVGLSVARTLASTREIPLYGMTSFEALSLLIENKPDYGIVLESKRQDVYFQAILNHQPQAPCVTTYEEILQTYPTLELIGNAGSLEFDQRHLTQRMIEAVRADKIAEGGSQPFYLRGADISQSQKKYRKLSKESLEIICKSKD